MSADSHKLPALDNTYGALLLGTCFGLMLYGLTLHQTYRYYRLYPKDRLWIKCLVAGIVLLETFHTIMCITAVYYQLVTHYSDLATLVEGNIVLGLLSLAAGLTNLICQCFYVYRVYQLGSHYGYKLPVAIAIACMVCDLAFIVAAVIEAFLVDLDQFSRFDWLVSATFGCAVLAELFLTGTLIVVLLRSRTGFKRTDSTIDILIVYAVNTGLLVGIFDLFSFVFALILPGNLIYLSVGSVGVKLYATSVLAVLNSRRSLSARLAQDLELGSFDPCPTHTHARTTVGPPNAPLAASKFQHETRPRPLALSEIAFATTSLYSRMDSTSEDDAMP
ncbi:hypothetical protein GY45DRAFT_1328862 [Cubamyces sp. BRFM 1775]|nr:hypothetical protein GY45DRAFT_1328862 [Cubamyces sp. BRFM 1775]